MDLEGIPGLSDELNSEVYSMNEEFSGHQDERDDADDIPDGPIASVDLDKSAEDGEEEALVRDFFNGEPCCTLGPNKSACWSRAGRERFLLARQNSLDLEKKEADLAVLATLRATRSFASHEVGRSSIKYQFGGMQICKTAFLFRYALGARRLKNLISHYDEKGLSLRVHKNTRKRPHNRTDSEDVEKIKGFIEQFADSHAMPLPGRLPTHKDYRVMLLPSDMSKSAVYRSYAKACESEQSSCISRRTFVTIWNELCPHIAAMKPATDLCYTCQQNANLLIKAANMPESIKSQRLQDAQKYLDLARVQRQQYNVQCATAKDSMTESDSRPTVMHYSFDYAQQVHYPFNAQQPGPIFFKTPRKCGIFGVSCEPTSSQVNYLIDESDEVGKAAQLHFVQTFLEPIPDPFEVPN